MITVKLYY